MSCFGPCSLQRNKGAFNLGERREGTQVRAGGGSGGSEERRGLDNNKEISLTRLFSVEILQRKHRAGGANEGWMEERREVVYISLTAMMECRPDPL